MPASSLGRGRTSTSSFFLDPRANSSRRGGLGDREQALTAARSSRHRELAEAAVVVVGVVVHLGRYPAGDDASRATVVRTGRVHRVLVVVAARLLRQQAFVVAEHHAVLTVRERAAPGDQRQRVVRLGRQEGRQRGAVAVVRRDSGRACRGNRGRCVRLPAPPQCDHDDREHEQRFPGTHAMTGGGREASLASAFRGPASLCARNCAHSVIRSRRERCPRSARSRSLNIASDRARLPRQIPYIIGNEGCERFSFYGMRNILTPFLITSLLLYLPESERPGTAKDVFHSFVIGVYFFPLLGGWLADRFFGKYSTVLWMSLVYCLGHACLAIFEHHRTGFFIGLGLIALGAGGIKPLVASFVGDQFDQSNKHLAKVVFDAFYWIINFGSFFASLLMPIFLRQFGAAVAFGIPGALMFVATVVFWSGRKQYVMLPPAPPDPHAFSRVIRTALLAQAPGQARPGLWVAVAGVAAAGAAFALLPQLGFVIVACLAL